MFYQQTSMGGVGPEPKDKKGEIVMAVVGVLVIAGVVMALIVMRQTLEPGYDTPLPTHTSLSGAEKAAILKDLASSTPLSATKQSKTLTTLAKTASSSALSPDERARILQSLASPATQ